MWSNVVTEHGVNPLVVFAGFVASVALVLTIVISSIALYRRTRQRQQLHLPSTVLTRRQRAKYDSNVATGSRRPTPACRDVIRLTAIEDVRKASRLNTDRELLKTDAADV